MINDKQLSVAWHVDDLKMSHIDNAIVEDFVKDMEHEFRKETPLSVS